MEDIQRKARNVYAHTVKLKISQSTWLKKKRGESVNLCEFTKNTENNLNVFFNIIRLLGAYYIGVIILSNVSTSRYDT